MGPVRLFIVLCLVGIGCAHHPSDPATPVPQQDSIATNGKAPTNHTEEPWKCPMHVASAPMAVACAEQFIRVNGYTEAPALPPERLTWESIEWSLPEDLAGFRHNSLQPAAYGYRRGRRSNAAGWTVIFCHTHGGSAGEDRPGGRAVTMDEDGTSIRVEHVDIFLDAAEEILKPCHD